MQSFGPFPGFVQPHLPRPIFEQPVGQKSLAKGPQKGMEPKIGTEPNPQYPYRGGGLYLYPHCWPYHLLERLRLRRPL